MWHSAHTQDRHHRDHDHDGWGHHRDDHDWNRHDDHGHGHGNRHDDHDCWGGDWRWHEGQSPPQQSWSSWRFPWP